MLKNVCISLPEVSTFIITNSEMKPFNKPPPRMHGRHGAKQPARKSRIALKLNFFFSSFFSPKSSGTSPPEVIGYCSIIIS